MRIFKLQPLEQSAEPIEVIAFDEASVLHVADRIGGIAADVFEKGNYRFTLRENPAAGFWTIFRKVDKAPALDSTMPCAPPLMAPHPG